MVGYPVGGYQEEVLAACQAAAQVVYLAVVLADFRPEVLVLLQVAAAEAVHRAEDLVLQLVPPSDFKVIGVAEESLDDSN